MNAVFISFSDGVGAVVQNRGQSLIYFDDRGKMKKKRTIRSNRDSTNRKFN